MCCPQNLYTEVIKWFRLSRATGRVAHWLVRSLREWQVTGTNPAVGKHVTDRSNMLCTLACPNVTDAARNPRNRH